MPIQSVAFDPHVGSDVQSDADLAKVNASTADSKAESVAVNTSSAQSTADANVSGASVADSKAESVAVNTSSAQSLADVNAAEVASAVGTEPGVGDFAVKDIKRNAAGDFIFDYDDSAIT